MGSNFSSKDHLFKLYGPWSKVKRLVNNLNPDIKSSAIKAQRKVAEKFIRIVKDHLRNQDIPGWTPLTEKYAQRKGSEDILIDKEYYLDAISVWRHSNIYYAGIPRGIKYPGKGGIEISRVALIHENKSYRGGPYRALWGPSWEEMGGLEGIKKIMITSIALNLTKKGYPVRIINGNTLTFKQGNKYKNLSF